MRIAHLSDLHFASWDWNISQLFSKRWLGNLNFIFGRRNHFDHSRLEQLPLLLKSLDVTHVIVTGDLSTTSAPAEFRRAKNFIAEIEAQGMEVFCIPGNHDHYTRKAYEDRHFYDYFSSSWQEGDLKSSGLTAKQLSPQTSQGWWIVGLDTALATSWFHSTGYFSPKTEQALEHFLQELPPEDQVLLVNHFPFFQHESPRKRLVRGAELQKVIEKHPQIKMYCHGHTHRRCIAPLKSSGLPLILDPGSTPHRKNGGWNLIELKENSASITHYVWNQDQWMPSVLEASGETYELV
ncbi:MAG: metallophosphoesterase [Rhabdochlamydiaceae bacterium]|nr:metallophosphoesterase [Rhabdochlamydiaceae bacterium]